MYWERKSVELFFFWERAQISTCYCILRGRVCREVGAVTLNGTAWQLATAITAANPYIGLVCRHSTDKLGKCVVCNLFSFQYYLYS